MLTEQQFKILEFITKYKNVHDGNAPNTVEIAVELKTSKQNIGSWLKKLQESGYIKIETVNNRVQHIIIINNNWLFDKPDIMDTAIPRTTRSAKARKEYKKSWKDGI